MVKSIKIAEVILSMDFAWNTQKNNMSDIKGLEKEQEREGKISNEEINLDKTHLNYDLVQSSLNLYQRVKQRVDEVRSVSRIQKNSVVDYSNIITVPKDQFEKWGIDKSKEYLKEVYNYFCKEFGAENVISAKVHLDETTPHMHLHFVPVNKENGKLQARSVMTPGRINKIHTDAPSYLQEKGFNVTRGTGKTEKSLEIHEFKLEKIKDNIKTLENNLKAVESEYEAIKGIKSCIWNIEHLEAKKSFLGGKITLLEKDYNKLVGLAKQGVYNADKIWDLERENKELKSENNSFRESSYKINKNLSAIRSDNTKLKNTIKELKEQGQAMFDVLSKHNLIPEATEQLHCMRESQKISNKVLKKSMNFDMER